MFRCDRRAPTPPQRKDCSGMAIRAGSYRVCSRIDEGEPLVLVITINTGNDVRDTVKRCLDRGLTW